MRFLRTPICGMLLLGSISSAHHGTTATYQIDKTVTISGTVTEFDFVYPHPQLYLDVKADDGTIQKWGAEWTPTPAMLRSLNVGWNRNSIKPGDQAIVVCSPHKKPDSTACWLKELTINGQKMKTSADGSPDIRNLKQK